jgi:hypothetical protein
VTLYGILAGCYNLDDPACGGGSSGSWAGDLTGWAIILVPIAVFGLIIWLGTKPWEK